MSIIQVEDNHSNYRHDLFKKCNICKTTITFYAPKDYNITGCTLAVKETTDICSKCKKKTAA